MSQPRSELMVSICLRQICSGLTHLDKRRCLFYANVAVGTGIQEQLDDAEVA